MCQPYRGQADKPDGLDSGSPLRGVPERVSPVWLLKFPSVSWGSKSQFIYRRCSFSWSWPLFMRFPGGMVCGSGNWIPVISC